VIEKYVDNFTFVSYCLYHLQQLKCTCVRSCCL